MLKRFILFSSVFLLAGTVGLASSVAALSGADFQAGHIIDDSIFFNGASLSAQDVQLFLSSKVPNCDTNGSQPYAGTTRASYGSSHGFPPPYTCLKDYRQDTPSKPGEVGLCNAITGGNRSAAEIIYEVGSKCGISQSALVVLLEKEQSLITDDWPSDIQYRSATGYGCPDTAPCDTDYYGFFNQVYNAARQFKRYQRDESLFRYRAFRSNYIQYNPSTSCGGSDVFIQNQATAGLYNYTPYQPNTSSLGNIYASGDSCGAYGNRNFWRLYNGWFGPTLSGEFSWRIIRTPNDSRLFLQVGNTKRWISSNDIYHDWTLDKYPINTISDDSFNSIPTIPDLTRLGSSGAYNYVVENGRKHYLPSNYTKLWGYQGIIAAPVNTLLNAIPENEPMGRFMLAPDSNSTYTYWVIDDGVKRSISPSDLAAWGYGSSNVVGIGSSYSSNIPVGSAVSRNIKFGDTNYVVDQGSLVKIPDDATATAWQASYYVPIGATAGSFFGVRATANFLVRANNSPDWYLLDGGVKYYVPSGDLATNWGASPDSLVVVSPDFLSHFNTASSITNFAKDSSTQKVYILDGQKHYIPSNDLLSTIQDPATPIITTSSSRLSAVANGSDYTKPLVLLKGTPDVYLFDKGRRYYVSSGALYDAYNAWGGSQTFARTLVNNIPYTAEPLRSVFRDGLGRYSLADAGTRTSISDGVVDQWKSALSPTFSDNFLNIFPSSAKAAINTRYVSLQSTTYIVDGGGRVKIASDALSSYTGSSTSFSQANNTLPSQGVTASYLVKSSDDQSYWLINKGSKINIGFAQAVTFGYLSTSYQPASLSSAFLATIPTGSPSSLLIRKENSGGVKFINFGFSLGFPNGDTLTNTASSANPVLVVDDATYDAFPLNGSITRIIKDDAGKLYLLESGKKRWITSWPAMQPYVNIPITYLYGTTMSLIPDGAPIN